VYPTINHPQTYQPNGRYEAGLSHVSMADMTMWPFHHTGICRAGSSQNSFVGCLCSLGHRWS
jgi:hypothetical protein